MQWYNRQRIMIHKQLPDGRCITTLDDGTEIKMPGPVSDSYDPEFSTGSRATAVREAIMTQRDKFTKVLGDKLLPIVDIANDEFECTLPPGASRRFTFTEREMRIIRFALNRAIDSI